MAFSFYGASKYKNKEVIVEGIKFKSTKEGNRYRELLLMQRGGHIKEIILQPRFTLQEGYTRKDGKKILPIYYFADFKVTYTEGEIEIEDVKGFKTAEFKLKEKMFNYLNPEYILKLV